MKERTIELADLRFEGSLDMIVIRIGLHIFTESLVTLAIGIFQTFGSGIGDP